MFSFHRIDFLYPGNISGNRHVVWTYIIIKTIKGVVLNDHFTTKFTMDTQSTQSGKYLNHSTLCILCGLWC